MYFLHGSTGDAPQTATALKDDLDQASAQLDDPPIVVFPTYYPDRSFVRSNYVADAVLNQYFAIDELPKQLMPLVEKSFSVYSSSDPHSSRYRAFGGFSMGAITTWYVLRFQPQLFYTYLPLAGDAWVPQTGKTASSQSEQGHALVDAVVRAREAAGMSASEVRILVGAGKNDSTMNAMTPQVQAFSESDKFSSKNIEFYAVPSEGHSLGALRGALTHYFERIFSQS